MTMHAASAPAPFSGAQRQRLSTLYQLQAREAFLRLSLVWYTRRVVPSHFYLKDFDDRIARWVIDTAETSVPGGAPTSGLTLLSEDSPSAADAAAAAASRVPLADVIRQGLRLLRPELRDLTQQLASDGIQTPLARASQSFSLTPLEADLLQLALCCLLDPRLGAICAAIRGRSDLCHPTLQLALELFAPSADERAEALAALLNHPPVISHRLLSFGADASRFESNRTPFLERDLLLPEPIARFLLEPLTPTPSPDAPHVPTQDLKLVSIQTPTHSLHQLTLTPDFEAEVLDLIAPHHTRLALVLSAKTGNGAPELAEAICDHLQRPICWINPVVAQTSDPSAWFDPLLQHLSEARLRDAIPAVRLDRLPRFDAQEPSPLQAEQANLRQTLELALARWPGPFALFITGEAPAALSPQTLDRPVISLSVPDLDRHTRAEFWRRALPDAAFDDADPAFRRLSHLPTTRHHILSVIRQMSVSAPSAAPALAPAPTPASTKKKAASKKAKASSTALATTPSTPATPAVDIARLEALCQQELNQTLAGFGKRIIPKESWGTLILPEETMEQLHELIARARHHDLIFETWGMQRRFARGGGLTALFSGPPGTGKTTAAEILAVELGATLYRVDMSRLVSKYVGETESNIGQIFSQASESGALLLFDEADSLFAKRTEVKTSMDRYSNQMVNYLLERLESYDGVAVLTTNLPKSIDDAFQRRIAIHVKFPEPTVDERVTMWRHFFPTEAPLDDGIDWYKLGQSFELTGGHIKNAAMRAAVLAAHRNTYIDDDVLFEAASREYRAMGRLIRT
jgi:hypothetical protein